MENNFTLAVVVFLIGMISTAVTLATILIAHARSEREFRSSVAETQS